MQSKATTVAAYLDELPEDRRTALVTLRKLIRRIAPKATENMEYGMPTYLMGDMLCAMASQKGNLALYVGDTTLTPYRAQLKGLKCGKGCIRFKRLDELPLDVVSAMLVDAVKRRQANAGDRFCAAHE